MANSIEEMLYRLESGRSEISPVQQVQADGCVMFYVSNLFPRNQEIVIHPKSTGAVMKNGPL